MTEMQTSVKDFNAYATINLDKKVSDDLFRFITLSIFRHPQRRRSSKWGGKKNKDGQLLFSKYQRMMPETLEWPLAARRMRAFIPGYNVQEAEGYKSGDHIIGAVQVYRPFWPHYMFEVDYLRAKKKPTRHFFEFLHHKNQLLTTQQSAETDPLFMENLNEELVISDLMSFRYWLEELSDARYGKNGYKEGMRRDTKSKVPDQGMSFAWPLLKNNIEVCPVNENRYDEDLPFGDEREPGTLAA